MEKVVTFGSNNNLVGILSRGIKNQADTKTPGVIILNAGLVHRVGPNRIYVKLARLLATHGFDVLRFDFSGVGDSSHRQDNIPFAKSMIQEIGFAMDFLVKKKIANEFILTGICSGANISFPAAYEDDRVVGIVPINFQPPETQLGQSLSKSAFYTKKAATSLKSWIRFISGKSSYRSIWNAIMTRMRIGVLPQAIYPDSETRENVKWLKTLLKNFKERNLRILMITSEKETGDYYLRQMVRSEINTMVDCKLLQFKTIPKADHMFTPLNSQLRLFEFILQWIHEFFNNKDFLYPQPGTDFPLQRPLNNIR